MVFFVKVQANNGLMTIGGDSTGIIVAYLTYVETSSIKRVDHFLNRRGYLDQIQKFTNRLYAAPEFWERYHFKCPETLSEIDQLLLRAHRTNRKVFAAEYWETHPSILDDRRLMPAAVSKCHAELADF